MSISGSGFGTIQWWVIDPETQAYIDTHQRLQSILSDPLPLMHKYTPRFDTHAQTMIDELYAGGLWKTWETICEEERQKRLKGKPT